MKLTQHIKIITVLGLLLWFTLPSAAQNEILSEAEFWQRMEATYALLVDNPDQAVAANDLWRDVAGIRLADESVMPVAVNWLYVTANMRSVELARLRGRVGAILMFRSRYTGTQEGAADKLADLQAILQQERFRGRANSTQESKPSSDGEGGGLMVPGLAQIILIGGGLLVVIGLLAYLWSILKVQPAAIAPNSDIEATPTSALSAANQAEVLQSANNYREAIRQLYLACLLTLDEKDVIHYDAALTNREHLEQLHNRPQLHQLMTQVVLVFDRVWYGFAPADESLYQTFRQYLDKLGQFE